MSWNPNQGQDPNQGQYGGYNPTPNPTDPYSGQQSGYQQNPYGQQQYGYQNPYGAAGGGATAASALGPTSMGMQANVAAGLSYIFGWITGLIFFLGEKQNQFVRFNAMQSIILSVALTVFYIVIEILTFALAAANIGVLAFLFGCLFWLVGLAAFIVWIILLINAFQGKKFKLPVIGDYAERYAGTAPIM
ncbi:MAG TPA: DUF4870 domain-containing protein [Ktedonobacteraceae bacterium]|nr:DUF4870 domain-containing protein [Ktedonobacteraceae bacterium]